MARAVVNFVIARSSFAHYILKATAFRLLSTTSVNWTPGQLNLKSSKFRQEKAALVTLGLAPNELNDYNAEAVRLTYFGLAKKLHPDSSSGEADRRKFEEAANAYQILMEYYKKKDETEAMQIEEDKFDMDNHTSPQHRQYLSYEGVGYGTPSQRRRQYDQWRADKASERVFEFRKDAMLRDEQSTSLATQEKENRYTRRIKTSDTMLRMADDMIKESMANGEFDNLAGTGKPLKMSADHNPYVDAHTHKLNSILIQNGYAPEWMTSEAEIRRTYVDMKKNLKKCYNQHYVNTRKLWDYELNDFRQKIIELNKKVDKLNMIAPSISVQMAHYNADYAISKTISEMSSSR